MRALRQLVMRQNPVVYQHRFSQNAQPFGHFMQNAPFLRTKRPLQSRAYNAKIRDTIELFLIPCRVGNIFGNL